MLGGPRVHVLEQRTGFFQRPRVASHLGPKMVLGEPLLHLRLGEVSASTRSMNRRHIESHRPVGSLK
jgi:hypothetical protein